MYTIRERLPHLHNDLLEEMEAAAEVATVTAGTVLMRDSQYVKVIPLVLDGVVKVMARFEDRELLLYYIQPGESCVMSFASGMGHHPSRVRAIAETNAVVALLPVNSVLGWLGKYRQINELYFQQYDQRYTEILETLEQLLFQRIDERLLDFLKERVKLTHNNPLPLSHREIAAELGTAREVVSRAMKKLETAGKVRQHPSSIEVF